MRTTEELHDWRAPAEDSAGRSAAKISGTMMCVLAQAQSGRRGHLVPAPAPQRTASWAATAGRPPLIALTCGAPAPPPAPTMTRTLLTTLPPTPRPRWRSRRPRPSTSTSTSTAINIGGSCSRRSSRRSLCASIDGSACARTVCPDATQGLRPRSEQAAGTAHLRIPGCCHR